MLAEDLVERRRTCRFRHGPRTTHSSGELHGRSPNHAGSHAEESELARFVELFAAGARVAFEVDEIDSGWEVGWSVLIGAQIGAH